MVEAIKDSDFCLLVTEPTPFGLNDLELAVEAVRSLGIPHGVVINRAGAGDGRVHDYCAAEGLEILAEIPDDRRLQRLQKTLASQDLLIIDELGFVPLSKTGAELLFEIISQRYERGSIVITSNLPFDEWTEVFGSERLTGALLDRLTHHVNILEMNGDSYRLSQSRSRTAKADT